MKHDLRITIFLIAFFLLAQVVGLGLVSLDMTESVGLDGEKIITHSDTSLGARPEFTGMGSFIYVMIGIGVGTLLVLLIARFKKINIWKAWFFLAVFFSISLALGVIIKSFWVFIIAFLLAVFKIFRPNIYIHNLTEILMYAGIAIFLVPIFNVLWATLLLLAISVYDFIAVFKSKHMVTMAKFQSESKVFAGLFIPYTPKKDGSVKIESKRLSSLKSGNAKASKREKALMPPTAFKAQAGEVKHAVLGGGDIAFPLIFIGAVMEWLVLEGLTKSQAFLQSSIIIVTTTIALGLLFVYAKKDKFYPAMPMVSAGCFIGYGIVLLIGTL